ncbi:MAPK regulated corepressor interacting protein 2 [Merluccius polli]|uniref:MAPK regulated corepressor interacting protein 2 n=1 Tax=Merluccius polli TaxID=89951 RepID=A0AA47P7S5_MERPO|nr:MAPK regulated corepressor interacting protein 2 [Merluccius polli]
MYTITRGPSKLATQRRTGPTQQIDNQINEFKHKQTSWSLPALPAPKIVFNRLSGKKYQQAAPVPQVDRRPEDSLTPAHEDNVTFVHGGKDDVRALSERLARVGSGNTSREQHETPSPWQEVVQQLEEGPSPGPHGVQGPILYKESDQPCPHMDNFMPIDLDEWWAQRFLANIDKLS